MVSTGIFNGSCSFLEYETYLEKLIKLSRKVIGCMPDFIFVKKINWIEDRSKNYHEIFIHNIIPDIIIMAPSNILIKNLIGMPRYFVEDIIIPWMYQSILMVENLLIIDVFNSQSHENE